MKTNGCTRKSHLYAEDNKYDTVLTLLFNGCRFSIDEIFTGLESYLVPSGFASHLKLCKN